MLEELIVLCGFATVWLALFYKAYSRRLEGREVWKRKYYNLKNQIQQLQEGPDLSNININSIRDLEPILDEFIPKSLKALGLDGKTITGFLEQHPEIFEAIKQKIGREKGFVGI
jgi:hypothetical protein